MNAAANTTTAGGLAAQIVVIVNWIITMFPNGTAMPTDVSQAWGFVLTALIGYYLHLRTQNGTLGIFLTAPKSAVAPLAPPPPGVA